MFISGLLSPTERQTLWRVALLLSSVYLAVVVGFGYAPYLAETMFSEGDSLSYMGVAEWMMMGNPVPGQEGATVARPFLYPLLLNLSRSFGGIYGIWLFQFGAWLASGLLLHISLRRLSGSAWTAHVGSVLFACNVSLILMTLEVMAEVTTTLWLSIGLAIVAYRHRMTQRRYSLLLLLLSCLLTCTKPVYYPLVLCSLAYQVYLVGLHIGRGGIRSLSWRVVKPWTKHVALIVMALSPLLLHLSIMRVRHHRFYISRIGPDAFRIYYFSSLYAELNGISLAEAREHVLHPRDMRAYVLAHPRAAILHWLRLTRDGIDTGSKYTDRPNPHPRLSKYMLLLNKAYFLGHLLMIGPVVVVMLVALRVRDYGRFGVFIALVCPTALVFLTCGVTFGEGDRIVLPVLPVWVSLYLYTVSAAFDAWRRVRILT